MEEEISRKVAKSLREFLTKGNEGSEENNSHKKHPSRPAAAGAGTAGMTSRGGGIGGG